MSRKATTPTTPPEGAPARSRAREIEGYRGLAAISTVLFHVWQQYVRYDAEGAHPPVQNPFVKALFTLEVIDFFFLLSAYLLTISYARSAIDGGSVRPAKAFLFRRAIRILPLYFLAVLVVWAVRNPDLPGDWRDLVEHLTFTHVLDRERIFYTLGPSWSLSLEILFYLALVGLGPLAVRTCRRLERRRSRALVCLGGCLALFAVPVLWLTLAHYGLGIPDTEWPAYFGPQARFGGFALGMGLAVAVVALGPRARVGPVGATLVAGLAATGLYALSLASGAYFGPSAAEAAKLYYHPAAALLWALLLYGTVHVRRQVRWQRVLTTRWLTGIGLVSYSLFIWHEPVMLLLYDGGLLPGTFLLAAPLTLAAAIPAACASYWLLERPASLLGKLRDGAGEPRDFYARA
ncbi:acyltransferase [Streptomyces sp. ODS28]|uniref:acyltransferase family protein n=1 Tax=Streptomyces sp. ODS28 TaxID=3136688 RepID=UPI0031EBBD8B